MKAQISHVAINVKDFEWHVRFFQDVFGMTIARMDGDRPDRKVWFEQGIQVNETEDASLEQAPGCADHIGIHTDDVEAVLRKSREYGCTSVPGKGEHWFQLPNGVKFELK